MNKNKIIKAFSLIELSVVISIVAIIATATLSFSISNDITRKTEITNQRIQTIYKAMGVFLAKNSYLPCVARVNRDKTHANYGDAESCSSTPSSGSGFWQSNTYANLYYGMVPITALGLPTRFAEDGFGTKLAYVIIKGFADATKFHTADSTTKTDGTNRIRIHKKVDSGTPTELTNDAMFVIISYGANKYGGWNANSTTQNSASSLTQETWNYAAANIDNPAGKADFYMYNSGSGLYPFMADFNNSSFDDILFYKTRTEMIKDFDLYQLLPCNGNTTESITYGSSVTYNWTGSDNIKYGEVVLSSTQCPVGYRAGVYSPTKKCGLYGTWETYHIHDCTP